mmetsp:Transcript_76419/g.181775  ORF Transcript_76419/g.181775 Transcript_76419/m.181775 type:complete len:458 (+) Transcript_76419:94-1467(+)
MIPRRVVVVGHGPVGHALIERLLDSSQLPISLTVICEEPRLAYNRVAMTSYFEHRSESDLSFVNSQWLQAHGVEVIFGRAMTIDRSKKRVHYRGLFGHNVAATDYDDLVLTTGSSPFVPPVKSLDVSLPGVFTYRTIDDMNALIWRAKTSKRAAVIGGGLLGLEAAKALLDLGLETHVLEVAPRLMGAQLDSTAAEMLRLKIEALGVKVHTSVKLLEVCHGRDGVEAVKFEEKGMVPEQVLPIELVVVSCGVRPRDELARHCGLQLGERGGVRVDAHLRSVTDPHIFAAGEVASVGGGMPYGLWRPGVEQADVLAATLGNPSAGVEYRGSDLSTKLKLLGVDVASFGNCAGFWQERLLDLEDGQRQGMRVTKAVDHAAGTYRKLVFECLPGGGRRLLGGVLVSSVEDYGMLCDLARSRVALWGLESAVLAHGPKLTPSLLEEQVYPTAEQVFPAARL